MATFKYKKPRSADFPPAIDGAAWIPLTRGSFCLVDNADLAFVSEHPWSLDADGYAVASIKNEKGKWFLRKLHRVLMNAQPGYEVDHVNHDRLDNRRDNLRLCTRLQNGRNLKKRCGKNKFKGVSKANNKWRALIKVNGLMRHIGTFETEEAAALGYNQAAIQYHGEFACLNRL